MSIFAELKKGIVTTSSTETEQVGRRLAAALPVDRVLALHGNLGVGKTTFVKGLAVGLGIHETVTSPTFNIFTLHRANGKVLIHLDAYRLESSRQIEDLMLDDFLLSPFFVAVEWPENISSWLPNDSIHLRLSIDRAGEHRIVLESS